MKSKLIFIQVFIMTVLFACKADKETAFVVDSTTDQRIKITSQNFEKFGIELGGFESVQVPKSVKVQGAIDVPPGNKAIVSAALGGYIKSTPPIVGSNIKKGQVIVSIENPKFIEIQQDYLETVQQLRYLEYEYDRHKRMKDENVISERSLRKSENEYKKSKARYNGLKKQLEFLNMLPSEVEKGNIYSSFHIYAPISGVITKVEVSKGSYISPEKAILEIVDSDQSHLELIVYEKDILSIEPGQVVKFKIPESSEKTFDARIALVNNSIDENRTIRIHADIENTNEDKFIVGMFVEAEIQVDSSRMKSLPINSIIDIEANPHILVLDDFSEGNYYFKRLNITVGEGYLNHVSVDVKTNEELNGKIVINGLESFRDL